MSRLKVAAKIATAALLAALVIVIGIVAYLKTVPGQQLILSRLNAAIPGSIALESLRFSLLAGTVDLQNPVLISPLGEKLLGCQRLQADIEWTALLYGTVAVADLLLESPWAKLRLDPSGGFNLMQAFKRPPSSPPTTFKRSGLPSGFWGAVIKSARISNGSLQFTAEGQSTHLKFEEINLSVDADFRNKYGRMALNTGRGELNSPRLKTKFNFLKLTSVFDNNRLDPLKIELGTSCGTAALLGRIDRLAATPTVDLALDLMIDLAALRSVADGQGDITGRITAKGTIRGPLDNPRISLNGEYGGGQIYGIQVDTARLEMAMQDRRVRTEKCAAQAGSGLLELMADINLVSAFPEGFWSSNRNLNAISYDLQLSANGMHLDQLGISHFRGQIDMGVQMTGTVAKPHMEATIRGVSLAFQDITLGNLNLQADLDKAGRLFVRQLTLKNQDSIIEGSGALSLLQNAETATPSPPPVFRAHLHHVDLHHFLRLDPTTEGVITGQLQLAGSLQNLKAEAELTAHRLVYNKCRLGDLTAVLHWNNGRLRLDRISLQNRSSALELTGTVQVVSPGTWNVLAAPLLDIQVNTDRFWIEDFWNRFKGELALTAQINGSAARPQGTIRVSGKNLDFDGQKIEAADLNAHLINQTVQIDRLQIDLTPQDTITGSGWVAFDKRFGFQLASQGVNLTRINRPQTYSTLEGTCVFNITGTGRLNDPKVEGNFIVKQVRFNQNPLDYFQLHVDINNRQARIQGNLNFNIDGSYDFRQKDFTLDVACRQTELAPYFDLLGRKGLTGRVSGTVRLAGNADDWVHMAAAADLAELNLFFRGSPVVRSSGLKITLKDQTIQIPGMHLALLQDGFLDLKGNGSLDGPLHFMADGQIPLEVLRPFAKDLPDLDGRLNVAAKIGGTRAAPTATIDMGLEQISLTVPVLMQKLQNLNGRLQITQNRIKIDNVTARLDTGSLHLTGTIDLLNFKPRAIAAVFRARTVPVRIPEMLDVLVDSDLKIAGSLDKSGIQGEVVLLEGLYYKDFKLNLLDTVAKKKRTQTTLPAVFTRPPLKNTALDITLKSRTPLRVENNLARLTIQPDLYLRGRLDSPVISGRAGIPSGILHFRKRKFDITKGVVDFANPYRTEPIVDIESQTQVRTWRIFLAVSGPPDQLVFRLRSEPAEEDNDILSLLLVGRTSHELISGEGGRTQSTEQILAEMIAATFSDDVKNATGLDIFEISSAGGTDTSTAENVKLTLGKEISRRLTVKYETGPKAGEITQRAIAEYKIMENILANGFQDLRGIFGGELQLRLEFW